MARFEDIEAEIETVLSVADGELTDEQRAQVDGYLEMLATQEADKIDGFAQYLRLESEKASAIDAEAKRLARRAQTIDRAIGYMKGRYLGIMQSVGVNKIKGTVYTLSIRETPVVRIENESAIPPEYWTEKITTYVNKIAIRDALKSGVEVAGARMGSSFSLQVR